MVGPVVYMEMVLGSRRGRQYIFRWIYAVWLVLQLLYFYWNYWIASIFAPPALFPTAVVSEHFVETFLFQQLILMVLATPTGTFVAGGGGTVDGGGADSPQRTQVESCCSGS